MEVKNVTLALVFALLFVTSSAQAQTVPEQDTICVPVEQLQSMQREVENLRRRDSINTEIKRNLRAQVWSWKR
jgi:hypothetical protein